MEKSKNMQSAYEEPLLEVILLTEADIISTSGGGFKIGEGKLILH